MKKITHWALAAVTSLFGIQETKADHLTAKYLFAAHLTGAQEVPAVTTNAVGVATFYVSYDMDSACLEMTVNGLSGAITGAHIHEAAVGVSGPVVVDLMPFLTGNRVKATLTGATLSTQFIAKLLSGMYYVNVHTAANPNGEIRGQLLAEEDKGMMTRLLGSQEVPAVVTTASGLGSFVLSKSQQKLSFHVVFDGLSSAFTGAHLHQNIAGQNGPVVLDLAPFTNGNVISGSVDPSSFLNALLSDSIYINVHTSNNPNGEIRGQLTVQPYLYYDAKMDTAQEASPVLSSNGFGVSTLKLNYTFDTLWYDAQVTGLTGTIQAAHFHKAALNVNGGVIVGIPGANIIGNMISGFITGTDLSDSLKRFLLEGDIYVNVHTATNPNGEVRGQVYRSFREGYTYHINGAQEVPMVNSAASGTGMVSIDRDQTHAHYMMTVNGLTNFTSAHFHNNIAGENGGVILDLTSEYVNGGISGFWTANTPTTPFSVAISNKFRKDSVYVNFHTTANPNGEIRGNVTRNLCNAIPTGITAFGSHEVSIKLYPNPAGEFATLDITLARDINVHVQLTDVMGRSLWVKEVTLTGGQNRVILPTASLAKGMYYVNIYNSTDQIAYKLMKE